MRQVKVILREAVLGLGEAGDLVGVKVGYARNFLLPQGKALLATDSKVRQLEHHKRVVMEKAARDLKDLKALCDRLESVALEVTARVGEEGKLFGSITTAHIAELLAEKGYPVDFERSEITSCRFAFKAISRPTSLSRSAQKVNRRAPRHRYFCRRALGLLYNESSIADGGGAWRRLGTHKTSAFLIATRARRKFIGFRRTTLRPRKRFCRRYSSTTTRSTPSTPKSYPKISTTPHTANSTSRCSRFRTRTNRSISTPSPTT